MPPDSKIRKVRRKPVAAPKGDVASSGGDYGKKTAKREERRQVRRASEVKDTKSTVERTRGEVVQGVRRAAKVVPKLKPRDKTPSPFVVAKAGVGGVDRLLSGKTLAGAVKTAGDVSSTAAKVGAHVVAPLQAATVHIAGGDVKETAEKIVGNAGRDLIDIPANAIPSVYVPLKKAVGGDPKGAAKMLAEPFVEAAKDPVKALTEHPVGTTLLASGAKAAVGRGTGKAMRSSPSKTLRKVARVERDAATVPGTKLREDRRYSKDIINKGVQVTAEKAKGRKVKRVMTPSQVRRRVDERFAADEDVRRIRRAEAVQEATRAVTNTRRVTGSPSRRVKTIVANRKSRVKPTAATSLIAQNITRASLEDLKAYRAELAAARPGLSGEKLRANKDAVKQIDKAIKNFDPGKTEVAARRFGVLSQAQQKQLGKLEIVAPKQAERASLVPYATRKMGATHDRTQGLMLNGKPLSTQEIRAHMKANNVSDPAFVTHAPGQRGARNFYVPTHAPPQVARKVRSGKAVTEGTMDLHPDTLVEGAARAQGLITAGERYSGMVGEFGVRAKSGKVKGFATFDQAVQASRDMMLDKDGNPRPDAVPMRPVRANAFGGRKAQLDELLDRADNLPAGAVDQLHKQISDALDGTGAGEGPWVLIPESAADQMRAHISKLSPTVGGRVGNLYGTAFRQTVLGLSPKWLTGNIVEAALRSMVAHAGPRSYVTGREALRRVERLDPEMGLEARVRATGGGHYALQRRSNVRAGAEQFAGTKLAGVATSLGKFWRTPGPKQVAGAWRAYTDFVFNSLNGRIESQFQTAMLGKALRDHPVMSDRAVKLSSAAIDQAARGMIDVNTLAQLGREVDRMYGRYSKFGPDMRRAVAAYTPFIAWTLNATRFILDVMPRDHPVATALVVASNQATEEWREKHGLRMFVEGAVPSFLQGSIPGESGSNLRASRYTPFGIAADPGENVAGLVLPQFAGALMNLRGMDWKGAVLRDDDGQEANMGRKALAAAVTLVEGSVPGAAIASGLSGAKLPNQATDPKDLTVGERAGQRFDPFKYTAPHEDKPRRRKVRRKTTDASGFPKLPEFPSLPALP